MREIKFRAFNTTTGKMIDLKAATPLALNIEQDGLFIPFNDNLKLMQYTGLKDKNGVEIYEWDVVRDCENNSRSTVEWVRTSWQLVNPRNRWGAYCSRLHVLEVIGNIYEHPDLLK